MYFKREIKSSKIGTKFIPALKYGAFFGFSRKNLFFICILQRSSDQSLQDSSTTFLRRSNYKIQWERIWATCITGNDEERNTVPGALRASRVQSCRRLHISVLYFCAPCRTVFLCVFQKRTQRGGERRIWWQGGHLLTGAA